MFSIYRLPGKLKYEKVIKIVRKDIFVLLKKNTQHAAKGVYELVPIQNFDEPWSDEKLFKKYELTKEEIDFIESMIRPMN